MIRGLLASAAIAFAGVISVTSAEAQQPLQVQIAGLHALCQQGNRQACIRFGIIIGREQQRNAEWRAAHPEWFWWERS